MVALADCAGASPPECASRLVIEITETAALDNIGELAHFVDALRHTGCRVALDDFGAGHTSLRHLQALDVDIVKIDGSFVRSLTARRENRIILRHLLGLTRGFGFSTVAECVETAEEAALLREEGVGYLHKGTTLGARPPPGRGWTCRSPFRQRAHNGTCRPCLLRQQCPRQPFRLSRGCVRGVT